MSEPLHKVCLVGANGTLGTVLLTVLLAAPFSVSILKRTSSTASTPPWATEIPIPDDLPLGALTTALVGQDAVIAAFPLTNVSQHLRLVEAALRAGVRRFIPADFGSCDARINPDAKVLKLYRDKNMVRDKCEQLAAHNSPRFTYTALVCGHFFDAGLRDGLLHFDLDTRTAQILDGGDIPASTSTLRRVGEAVVAILSHPDATRNRTVYVQSFCPTQNQVLAALERVTGQTWTTQRLDSQEYLEEQKKRLEGGDDGAIKEIVFVLGTRDADWRRREGFAMGRLGLQDEDLEDVVRQVVTAHGRARRRT